MKGNETWGCRFLIQQNFLIYRIRKRLIWKGSWRSSTSNTSAMGRNAFHYPRLLEVPSSLALNTSRMGHLQFLWQPASVPHYLHSKEFLPNIYSKPPLLEFKTVLPWTITTFSCKKSLFNSLVAPFRDLDPNSQSLSS